MKTETNTLRWMRDRRFLDLKHDGSLNVKMFRHVPVYSDRNFKVLEWVYQKFAFTDLSNANLWFGEVWKFIILLTYPSEMKTAAFS